MVASRHQWTANSTGPWCPVFSCSFRLLCYFSVPLLLFFCSPSANNKAQQLWNFIFQLRWSCYLRYRGAMIKTDSISLTSFQDLFLTSIQTLCVTSVSVKHCYVQKKKTKQKPHDLSCPADIHISSRGILQPPLSDPCCTTPWKCRNIHFLSKLLWS